MARMSVKAFWEAVEHRLAACSAEELRVILRSMAQETPPADRERFLDQLHRVKDATPAIEKVVRQDELLADIDDLLQEVQTALENPEAWDEWYGWDTYDDEDTLGPYEGFLGPLTTLLDRTQATFEHGDPALARTAYEKLFAVFDLQDDYGRGVQAENLETRDMAEARARYLRAVYETEPLARRPQALFEHMRAVRSWLSRPRPMLEDILEISPQPLPDQDRFFPEWVALLRSQDGSDAEAWLREAIRLSSGTPGLEELARAEGRQRPRAYLDWFAALAEEGKHQEVLAAAQEALQALPADLPIRAAVADHLCAAAARLGEPEALRAGRWEAFTAKPTVVRLLDLWDAAPAGEERTRQMHQAAQWMQEDLARPPHETDAWRGPREDTLELPEWTEESMLAHAQLLAGDWEAAYRLAADEYVLGWSSGDSAQGLVVACFLVGLSGKSLDELPPNLTQVWQWGLEHSTGSGLLVETEYAEADLLQRLERMYAGSLPRTSVSPDQRERFLAWCLDVSRRRVEAIVGNQHRGSYDRAAVLIAACGEVLQLLGKERQAEEMLEEVRQSFPRHRAFQAELREAVQRMRPGAEPPGHGAVRRSRTEPRRRRF